MPSPYSQLISDECVQCACSFRLHTYILIVHICIGDSVEEGINTILKYKVKIYSKYLFFIRKPVFEKWSLYFGTTQIAFDQPPFCQTDTVLNFLDPIFFLSDGRHGNRKRKIRSATLKSSSMQLQWVDASNIPFWGLWKSTLAYLLFDKNVIFLATTHNISGLTRRELSCVVTRNKTLSIFRNCIKLEKSPLPPGVAVVSKISNADPS